ncbi:uncharacterized protein LOC119501012 isoform X1 [Sebastes umbrosus]|uniref:uncharacterized protein LOC119501012 isoform X1 n=1 Tax=Sebastes umbrosus TaxID=72105 RepID=UPI00189CA6D3|nr:uncharacterized protein LOC119501012 isoform X1 [Sebastes umbrosus]
MTSRRHLFLFMFLSTVDLSKQGCLDNFDLMKDWGGNLTDTVSLVKTQYSKDTMECTLERECLRGTELACGLLSDCYYRDCKNKSEKCEGDSQDIYFYHFMCLLAKTANETVKGCEYDTVCELYSEISSTDSDQKTTLPPTTTTLPPTTTTLPPTTTTLPPTTTTLPPTTVTQLSVTGCTDKRFGNNETDTLTLKMVLMMSGILNVVLPLAVYLYMRDQRTKDRIPWDATYESNGNPPGDQPMTELKSTPMTFTNGAGENTHLMQPSDCQSVLTHSAERL